MQRNHAATKSSVLAAAPPSRPCTTASSSSLPVTQRTFLPLPLLCLCWFTIFARGGASSSNNSTGTVAPLTYLFNSPSPPPVSSYGARYGHTMLSCSGGIHVLGGTDHAVQLSVYYNDIATLRYNATAGADQWSVTTKAAPWPARAYFSALALPGDTVIITGGLGGDTWFNDVWLNTQCVDSDKWLQVSNTTLKSLQPRYGFGFVYYQGSVVVLGGRIRPNGDEMDSSQMYSLAYNEATHTFATKWVTWNNAPWRAREFSCVVYNDSIYIIGGYSNVNGPVQVLNSVWSLSGGLSGNWTHLGSDGTPGRFSRRYGGVAAVWQNQIIYATGRNATGFADDIWSYSSETQQWQLLNATSLMPHRASAAILNVQGRLLITGGYSDENETLSDIWISDYEYGQPTVSSSSSSSSTGSGSSGGGSSISTSTGTTGTDSSSSSTSSGDSSSSSSSSTSSSSTSSSTLEGSSSSPSTASNINSTSSSSPSSSSGSGDGINSATSQRSITTFGVLLFLAILVRV